MQLQKYIEDQVKQGMTNPMYFNFGLTTSTWRLFVNKQITMRYERLFIEKQMNDVRNKKQDLERQLNQLENDLTRVRQQKENFMNMVKREEQPQDQSKTASSSS